jgi:hypothetical protein
MSQYTASVPSDGQVKPEIRSFFEEFYKVSDTPDALEKYADQFTKGGKLIMGPNEVNGRDGTWPTSAPSSLSGIRCWLDHLDNKLNILADMK